MLTPGCFTDVLKGVLNKQFPKRRLRAEMMPSYVVVVEINAECLWRISHNSGKMTCGKQQCLLRVAEKTPKAESSREKGLGKRVS